MTTLYVLELKYNHGARESDNKSVLLVMQDTSRITMWDTDTGSFNVTW